MRLSITLLAAMQTGTHTHTHTPLFTYTLIPDELKTAFKCIQFFLYLNGNFAITHEFFSLPICISLCFSITFQTSLNFWLSVPLFSTTKISIKVYANLQFFCA